MSVITQNNSVPTGSKSSFKEKGLKHLTRRPPHELIATLKLQITFFPNFYFFSVFYLRIVI